ncbi:MFS transporter [Paenibacillus sp. LMG 31456]|uniref:MFS transporter n=1 Tax=Paenibacillus foliorum TaxID=2654974 RepID=A0A972JZQ9_9BACL|nr:MFS transporter [Paenibacillus foliorum]NOU92108.1 MFS transporter [Paenibacillus foliorum]
MTTSQSGEKLIRVLAFTLILSVMNATMFNVALPTIGKEFQLTASQVSWVVTAYIIVYAIGSVTYGKLADKYRLKDLLTIGLTFFAVGSLLGFAATHYWMIIAGRILQSIGASVIPATAMIIPVRYFPPETRGRALGITSSGLALGTAIGPIIAGFVTSLASWRYLFLLSVIVLITLPYYRKYLDDNKGTAGKTDLLGGSILAITITVFLLGITSGAWTLFIVGAVLLVLFIVHIHRSAHPFIQPSIFKNKNYTIAIVVSFIGSGLGFGIPFIIPQMLTQLNQLSPAVVGFVMFPGAIIASILGRTGGKLADQRGNVVLVLIAVALQFVSFVLLSITAGIQPTILWIFLIFGNIGATFLGIGLSNTVSRTLPREQTGVGMGLFMMANFISGAIATSLIGKMLDSGATAPALNPLLLTPSATVFSNIFLVLSLLIIVNTVLFYFQFGRQQADSNSAKRTSPDKNPA